MENDRRFGSTERLFGQLAAQKIKNAHIAIVGIGGVGSWAAEALARSGVAALTLIDLDHVSESNINRQVHATEGSIGQAKVLAMRDRIHSFFPQCQVRCVEEFVDWQNCSAFLPHDCAGVIDACDQVRVKTALAAWSLKTDCLFVSSGAAGGKRMAHLANVDDLARVTHDPLLAKVRYGLRKQHGAHRDGKKMGVACVFSAEPVAPPLAACNAENDGSLNCHGYGSLATVTASFGLCAAGFVLNQLAR
jgi:tRNA A37 threonylcarbamoyladenosine dehydratase